ncbi:MAG: hypothetical protein HZB61_08295 [Nitrospirae bacterium]|nr:hypothetical protein [Nitrospirota bacterium]
MANPVRVNISNRVYLTIFLVSCSTLMFEVSLTRIFSISLWYHFAFMVISIAMLGIGSAGTMLSVISKSRFLSESIIGICSLCEGVALLVCYAGSNNIPFDPARFSWDRVQILYLSLYCLVLSVPFFFAGALTAAVFTLRSDKARSIYCSDLLGAGTGSLIVLVMLSVTAPEYAIVSASILCFTGAIISGKRHTRSLSFLFLLISLPVLAIHPAFMKVKISPYKSLSQYLQHPGAQRLNTFYSSYSRVDTFKSPAVRFAPGLSLLYPAPLPQQIGLAIDGDRVDVITSAQDSSTLEFLEFLPSSAAYEISRKDSVLIIDPKGGLHALMAMRYDSKNIQKVESNPLVIKIVKDNFNEFSGKIFENNTTTGYARSFLHSKGNTRYDLIEASMSDISVAGIFGISEDYSYTVEAFKQYLRALKKDGMLSISLYLVPPPRTELRVLATIVTAFEQMGGIDARQNIAALRSWDSMTIIFKNSTLTEQEIERLRKFSRDRRFDLVYYPGIKEGESNLYVKLPSDEYFNGFINILDPETRASFLDNYLFDIRPVYDNNPFFHYFLKIKNLKVIYQTMGQKWLYFLQEGYLLPVLLIIVAIISAVLIILPLIFNKLSANHHDRHELSNLLSTLVYFAMLGLGFMFVEVSLIQKSILLFENPSYSVVIVLASILASSGLGSIISSRFIRLSTPYSLLVVSFFILTHSVVYPSLADMLLSFNYFFKVAIMSAAIFPLGFFMGIPFPMGIRSLGEKSEALVPWAWAINACMSVLAPILTIMLALITGFQTVLLIGALAYLLAFTALKRMRTLKIPP